MKNQKPPLKIILSKDEETFEAILPYKYDLDLAMKAFIGLLKDSGWEEKEIQIWLLQQVDKMF